MIKGDDRSNSAIHSSMFSIELESGSIESNIVEDTTQVPPEVSLETAPESAKHVGEVSHASAGAIGRTLTDDPKIFGKLKNTEKDTLCLYPNSGLVSGFLKMMKACLFQRISRKC
ncbi:hypothetical protein JCM33374_g4897 [Metschnikowia sp. JCM 33374]|nr:hypothetical protein JCM33374_g4897 [Metschnikowia sp. JCM 33374]